MHALSVDLAERSYPVLVGAGARHEVARFVPPGAKLAAVVTRLSAGVLTCLNDLHYDDAAVRVRKCGSHVYWSRYLGLARQAVPRLPH